MTLNYSQSVAGCAIPVNATATGMDTQSCRKERADHLLSAGMMGDVHAPSSGAPWKAGKLISVTVRFPLRGPRFCSPSPYLSVTLWRIRVKVTRLTAEVNQQEILSDPDSEDEKFSDSETQTRNGRVKSVLKISQVSCTFTKDFTNEINMSYL